MSQGHSQHVLLVAVRDWYQEKGVVFWQACPKLPQHLHADGLGCARRTTGSRLCPSPSPLFQIFHDPPQHSVIAYATAVHMPSPVSRKESSRGSLRAGTLLSSSACRRGGGCGVSPGSASLLFATHSPRERRVVFQGPHIALHTPPRCCWAAKMYLNLPCWLSCSGHIGQKEHPAFSDKTGYASPARKEAPLQQIKDTDLWPS